MSIPWRQLTLLALLLTLTGCQSQQEEHLDSTPPLVTASAEVTLPQSQPQEEEEIIVEETPVPTLAQSILDDMSTQEKIGQLFMMDFRTDEAGNPMTTLSATAAQQIADYHLGGVILFSENIETEEQTIALISDIQGRTDICLFIGIDEEGGLVSRLGSSQIPHQTIPAAGKISSDQEAADSATAIGTTLSELGVNVDFAPVADVNTNPSNPVIGSRAYSSDPQEAAQRVSAFLTALQETGVAGVAKHFPGHGDTTTDSHSGFTSLPHDLERLEAVEFVPFEAAIQADVGMILVGHISLPNVTGDDILATLSPQIIDLLRTDLSYGGVIITDAMNMGAITQSYGAGEATVLAILAGIDIVLMPADLPQAYEAVAEAVDSGRISQQRLDDSVLRILQMKDELHLLSG